MNEIEEDIPWEPTQEQWERRKLNILRRMFRTNTRIFQVLREIPLPDDIPLPNIDTGEVFFIYGDLSTGKTIMASQICQAYVRQQFFEKNLGAHKGVMFQNDPHLLSQIKQSWEPGNPLSERELMGACLEADLLVMDEIGMGKPTDWLLECLYLIVDGRYRKMKPTIYTSNHSLEGLTEFLGDERISSRIVRCCTEIKKRDWTRG